MGKSLEIKHTSVFERNWNAYNDEDIRYIVNQGGSRSSKSISILQCLIVIGMQQKLDISIVRKTLPSVKSIMKDFFDLLVEYNIYEKGNHNKSSSCYTFSNGSFFEFFGADNDQKLRGKKRDVLFCNEANELDQAEFVQLVLRTTGKVFIDFNPSDTDHFIYDVVKDEKSILIKSTYKDNPFLEKQQVEYIENLINVDENYYKIYALGERPTSTTRIYSHFKQLETMERQMYTIIEMDGNGAKIQNKETLEVTYKGWHKIELIDGSTTEAIDREDHDFTMTGGIVGIVGFTKTDGYVR
jgi:phage terminase large subunit